MNNKEQEKDIASFQFDNNNHQDDYKVLLQKLKSISEIIYFLEKNFLDQET